MIFEADITKGPSVGRAVGKAALGTAASFVPGAEVIERAGALTIQIVKLLKSKKDAKNLILKAMSLPDSDREDLNIFDIDDDLWGRNGILSEKAKAEIYDLVKKTLDNYVAKGTTLPPNFANSIAVKYVQSKLKA